MSGNTTAAGPGGTPGRHGRQERTAPGVWRAVNYLMDHRGVGVCVAAVCGVVSLGGLALQLGGAA